MEDKSKKIWYLWLDGKEEGPYSFTDLRSHPVLSPDLLVRKEGSSQWLALRNYPELQQLFEDPKEIIPEEKEPPTLPSEGDELTLSYQDPSSFWFWIVILGIVLTYILMMRGS